MSDIPKAVIVLRHLLDGTRTEEIDCDRFLELVPAYLDGRISDAEVRELIAHHVQQCPECSEELAILRRAISPDPT